MDHPKTRAFLAKAGWENSEIENGLQHQCIYYNQSKFSSLNAHALVGQIFDLWDQSGYRYSIQWLDFLEKALLEEKGR